MSEHTIRPIRTSRLATAGAVMVLAAGTIVFTGLTSRSRHETALAQTAAEEAVPTVNIVTPTHETKEEDLALPGTIEAFTKASIYPRATGYVKDWTVDIGAHVKAGQVLATIESPDLDQQLQQARANLVSADANAKLAATTARRWSDLVAHAAVSQQDADEKTADAAVKAAASLAAKADVARLEDLASFKTLKAPFDGVVTARSVDIGDLVNAGGTTGTSLFQVSDMQRVRIYVRVPQAFLAALVPGLQATLTLPQYRDQTFSATLVTTSNSVAEDTRTALVELQADNSAGKLWPGTYAEVHFHIPADPTLLEVPATALLFGQHGTKVAVVDDARQVRMQKVDLGPNLGANVEVLSGLSPAERLIDNPSESLETGDLVKIAAATPPASKQAGTETREADARATSPSEAKD